jgi:hypothetical protein
MESTKRDLLLGTLTWWGFHALLLWMGAWHFLSRQVTDGNLFASDIFAGLLIGATVLSLLRLSAGRVMLRIVSLLGIAIVLLPIWQGTFQWGSVTDLALWGYTYFSFGPMSWRHALYTPLGIFGMPKV